MALRGSSGGRNKSGRSSSSGRSGGASRSGRGTGSSGGGSRSTGLPSRGSGGAARRSSGSNAPTKTGLSGARGGVSRRGLSGGTAGVQQTPGYSNNSGRRFPWVIVILGILFLCCIVTFLAAWFMGDSAVEILRQLQ